MKKLANRVKVAIATTGTGTITFGAAISAAFFVPADVGYANGDVVPYTLTDGFNVEMGFGTIGGSVTTLSRDTVRISKIAGIVGATQINLDGAATLSIGPSAEDLMFDQTHGTDIASAATLDLEDATGGQLHITGTTTITAITLLSGHVRWAKFTGACQITAGSTLAINGGGGNVTTAPGDYARFVGEPASVNVTLFRASGKGVVPPAASEVTGLAASATTDTTNASNISSGTLPAARLPAPAVASFGGVKSNAGASHQWIATINTDGTVTLSQPGFADISGAIAASQLPNPGAGLGGILANAGMTHKFVATINTDGSVTLAQPAFTDISGNIAVAQINGGTGATSTTFLRGDNTWVTPNDSVGFGNLIRNPCMDIAQRGTSGTVVAGSGLQYTLDGHQIYCTGANAAWSQVWSQDLYGNALRVNCATGMSAFQLWSKIESNIAAQIALAASAGTRTFTVQWTITNNTGASITPSFFAGNASTRDNFGSQVWDEANVALEAVPVGTSVVACTFTPGANAYLGYAIVLVLNLNAASGYVSIGNISLQHTPGAALGLNSTPTRVERPPIGYSMTFCERYFQTTYDNGVAPGTATHGGITGTSGATGTNNGSGANIFRTPMFKAPTVSYWDGAGTANKLSYFNNSVWTDGLPVSGVGVISSSVGQKGFSFYHNSPANVSFHYAATAEL